MRILVTGANGDVADGAGRVLRSAFPDAVVEGSDLGSEWPARDVFAAVHRLPSASDPEYLDALAALVAARSVDIVVPGSEPELVRIASDPLASGLPLLSVDAALVTTFLDKLTTARWLTEHGIATPDTTDLADAVADDLPLVIKPRRGGGSRDVAVVRTAQRLTVEQRERTEPCVAQQLLPDDDAELTCVVAVFGDDVRLLQLRRRLASGVTVSAVVDDDPAVEDLLRRLASEAGHQGSINVQLRLTPEGPKVFEVNPRLSSTVKLRHDAGFTDLVWWVMHHRGDDLAPYTPVATGTRLFRLSREVIVAP